MVEIRLAQQKEALEIATMSRDYIEAGLKWSWNAPRVVRSIRAPDSVVIVSLDKSDISGFAIMVFHEHTAHLNLLAVKPGCRRHGTGKQLLAWLEKSAITAGTFQLSLEVRESNPAAQAFYTRLGYQHGKAIVGYYEHSEAAIQMSKNLSVLHQSPGAHDGNNRGV